MMSALLLLAAVLPLDQETPVAEPLAVQTWVSQSAVWPGDRIEYSVRLVLAPGIRLADEALSAGEVRWEPFRVVDFRQRDDLRSDGSRVVTLTYDLVAVDLPDEEAVELPALRFSYAQSTEGPSAEIPMQEKVVTGPRIAFGSMLEGGVQDAVIRDGRELEETPLSGRTIRLIGIGGLLLGALAGARFLYPVVKLRLSGAVARTSRVERKDPGRELAALRQIPLVNAEDYERLYRGLYQALRDHLSSRFGVQYAGLTALDADGLRRAGIPDDAARRIEEIVREGEQLRYQRRLPDDAELRACRALASLEQILAA